MQLNDDSENSTEESDNDNGLSLSSPPKHKLNINSREFHLKVKDYKSETSTDCQAGLELTSGEIQEGTEFRNFDKTHPKNTIQTKKKYKNKERANHFDRQEATIKKPRKKFNCKHEKDKFVESYKMKKKTEICKNWELTGNCKFGDE